MVEHAEGAVAEAAGEGALDEVARVVEDAVPVALDAVRRRGWVSRGGRGGGQHGFSSVGWAGRVVRAAGALEARGGQ